jgi:multidrug efflux pump subunit AcrB
MMRIFRYFVDHSLVIHLVSIFLVVLGLYGVFNINREAFPNVNLDQIYIDSFYSGATPQEVERLVITPIEQEIKQLTGIDKMTSIAFPGSGRIILELDPHANNRSRLASDVQLAVDRADLPRDLPNDPVVTEIDGSVFPIVRIAVAAPRTSLELKRLGDRLRDDLLDIQGIGKVVIQGGRKAEIRVTVDPDKLRQQRVSIGEIASAVTNWNVNSPGGDIDTPGGQKVVRVSGEFKNAEDAANLVLRANESGGGLRLKDVAAVTESLEEPRIISDVSGEPAVSLIVMKQTHADIIATIDLIFSHLKTVPERYGQDVRVQTFQDFSRFARTRLNVLTNNALVGIVLVLATLALFLRPAVAVTTTWGLPIVFLTGLYTIYVGGITLNLISMMGFIIALGMLVDDAIIVGENITYHMEQGMEHKEAAAFGAYELLGPVTSTVTTTIVAFLPLMFMTGIIGKFVVAIPIVVIVLLVFSWLEAFFMLPSHAADIVNPNKQPKERRWLSALENAYTRLLGLAVRHRYVTLFLAILVLAGSFVLAATKMSFQLFPSAGVEQWIVRVTAPAGTNIERMRQYLIDVDREVRTRVDPEYVEATVLTSGEISIDDGDPLTQRGSRFGQIRVLYTPAATRPRHDALSDMHRIAAELPPLFSRLEIAFGEVRPGPPTGRALQVEIMSHDIEAGEGAARRLMARLDKVHGVVSIDSGLKQGDAELHVVLNRALSAYAGIDLANAAQHVRAAAGGLVVSTTRRGTEEIDVTIRYPKNGSNDFDALRNLRIPNSRGGLAPLAKIARFEEQQGFTAIRHRAGIRTVSVVADINTDVITSLEINRLVRQSESDWVGDAAPKVSILYGGEEEKNIESVRSLVTAFVFAALAVFFILAIQFNSIGYPIIVMLSIPFGAVGVVLSFFLHDLFWKPMPLSFFALMGVVALSGVVVNSALVLLVFVQRAVRDGMEYYEAILLAGRRRLRAVILTAFTTVVGLLPTAYGWGGLDPFVSPVALSLSWGLIFATLITLIVIPAALAVGVDISSSVHRTLSKNIGKLHGKSRNST